MPAWLPGGRLLSFSQALAIGSGFPIDIRCVDAPYSLWRPLCVQFQIYTLQLALTRQTEQGFTALLVTHDVEEAVALCDRVILLEAERIALEVCIDLPRPRASGTVSRSSYEKRSCWTTCSVSPGALKSKHELHRLGELWAARHAGYRDLFRPGLYPGQ